MKYVSAFLIQCIFSSLLMTHVFGQPANDDCSTATTLIVNSNLLCEVFTPGTILAATESSDPENCFGTFNDDVWYKFVATKTEHEIQISNIEGSYIVMSYQFSIGNCGSLTELICDNQFPSSGFTASNLTIGTTYYIRVATWTHVTGQTTTFDICVGTNIPIPPNDECITATALTINTDANCTITTPGTIAGATASSDSEDCSGTFNDDVWYSFVATATSHKIHINNVIGMNTFMSYQLSSGICGVVTEVLCHNAFSASEFYANALTIGETYYLRIATQSNIPDQVTTFDLCITTPPIPINDECVNAINVEVNEYYCTSSAATGTNIRASNSPEPLSCSINALGDVWYAFTVPNGVTKVKLNRTHNPNILGFTYELYSGTCSALSVQRHCTSNPSWSNLTPGETYLIRIIITNKFGPFEFCLYVPPPFPPNDECENPESLIVNSDLNCSSFNSGTVYGASHSNIGEDCSFAFQRDVFYSFIATSTAHQIQVNNLVGSNTDMFYSLSTGSCLSADAVACQDDPDSGFEATDLTIGTSYRLRVSTRSSSIDTTSFDICIGTWIPPTNDDCIHAIPLTVNADLNCDFFVSGTVKEATASSETVSCSGTFNDDVWYSFVATAEIHEIQLSNFSFNSLNMVYQLATGSCGAITELLCHDDPDSGFLATNLNIGTTYYVRVASFSDTNTFYVFTEKASFDICITTPPPAPVNDDCVNVVHINLDAYPCSNSIIGSTISATSSPENPPTCAQFNGGDIWFSFTVPAGESEVIFEFIQRSGSVYRELYSGSCTSLVVEEACTFVKSGLEERYSGLISGETYLLRLFPFQNNPRETFEFCLFVPPSPPPNDECVHAIHVTVDSNVCSSGTTIGTNLSATDSTELPPVCGNYAGSDIWYSLTVPAGETEVRLDVISGFGAWFGELYSNHCASLTIEDPCSYLSPTFNKIYTGLNSGQTYLLRLFQNGNTVNGTVEFCLFSPPPPPSNDDCNTATSISCGSMLTGENTIEATDNGDITGCFGGSGIWYEFAPSESGTATLTLAPLGNFAVNTSISSSTDCTTFSNILCNRFLTNEWVYTAGTTYYIYVGHPVSNVPGTFDLELSCSSCISPTFTVFQDCPENPTVVLVDVTNLGTASSVNITNNENGATHTDVGIGTYPLTGFNLDSGFTVTVADQSELTCQDSQVITIDYCPPSNDNCSTATILNCDMNLFNETTFGASRNGNNTGCSMGNGIWYEFTSIRSGIASVRAIPDFSNIDIEISISTSVNCTDFENVGCMDIEPPGFQEIIVWDYIPNVTYYIFVGTSSFVGNFESPSMGEFDLFFTCNCSPEFTAANGNQLNDLETGPADYKTDGIIESIQQITGSAGPIQYNSGIEIHLLERFEIVLGAAFEAFIEGCN